MARVTTYSPEQRAAALEQLAVLEAQGKSVRQAAAEMKMPAGTLETWRRAARGADPPTSKKRAAGSAGENEGEPKAVIPPPIAQKGARKAPRRPITEQTAGALVAGLFSIAAMLDREGAGVWFLTTEERDALARPMADSLRVLPSPVADAIEQYTAPGVFATTLATVIGAKMRRRAEATAERRKRAAAAGARPGAPTPPPNLRPVWAAPTPPTPPRPNGSHNSATMTPEAADAIDAARGALSGIDEHENADAEAAFIGLS
jgi:transposase-like protein